MASRQQHRKSTLAKLNTRITRQNLALSQLKEDKAELERILEEVTQALASMKLPGNNQPFASFRGKLSWPVSGKISHRFGSSRVAGKLNWDGVMINAAGGTQVKAIYHGRIVFSDYLRGHGMLLIIDHGDGYMSLYAHNQILYKVAGDWVSEGETIATVGSTGGRSAPGLYFEIRHRGKPDNPAKWCRRQS